MVVTAPHAPELRVTGSLCDGENVGELCQIIERIFPVRFTLGPDAHHAGNSGGKPAARVEIAGANVETTVPSFVVDETAPAYSSAETALRIEFSDDVALEPCLRKRHLAHKPLSLLRPVKLRHGDRILAKCGGQ